MAPLRSVFDKSRFITPLFVLRAPKCKLVFDLLGERLFKLGICVKVSFALYLESGEVILYCYLKLSNSLKLKLVLTLSTD